MAADDKNPGEAQAAAGGLLGKLKLWGGKKDSGEPVADEKPQPLPGTPKPIFPDIPATEAPGKHSGGMDSSMGGGQQHMAGLREDAFRLLSRKFGVIITVEDANLTSDAPHQIKIPIPNKIKEIRKTIDGVLKGIGFSEEERKKVSLSADSVQWNVPADAMKEIFPKLDVRGFNLRENLRDLDDLELVDVRAVKKGGSIDHYVVTGIPRQDDSGKPVSRDRLLEANGSLTAEQKTKLKERIHISNVIGVDISNEQLEDMVERLTQEATAKKATASAPQAAETATLPPQAGVAADALPLEPVTAPVAAGIPAVSQPQAPENGSKTVDLAVPPQADETPVAGAAVQAVAASRTPKKDPAAIVKDLSYSSWVSVSYTPGADGGDGTFTITLPNAAYLQSGLGKRGLTANILDAHKQAPTQARWALSAINLNGETSSSLSEKLDAEVTIENNGSDGRFITGVPLDKKPDEVGLTGVEVQPLITYIIPEEVMQQHYKSSEIAR